MTAERPEQWILSQALHVPKLQNNLMSILHLTRKCGFHIIISSNHMDFIEDGVTRLTAPINENNMAFLEGETAGNTELA